MAYFMVEKARLKDTFPIKLDVSAVSVLDIYPPGSSPYSKLHVLV